MSAHLPHSKYRRDIDGLRAIAVLSVVSFHAFPDWVPGGFIGVDVFFVISGFLISTIIFESLDKGTFSFADFYARRIRRIFPALIIVLVASFAFGWLGLLADEYKQLAKHIAAGAAFVSNFVLWKESGYFDNAADTKPFLHLWSLGIEEQFYIVWPLLLWFAYKRRLNLLSVGVVIAIISFLLNLREAKTDAVADFYSPQTRFWELMCGSILAWLSLHKLSCAQNLVAKLDGLLEKAIFREERANDGVALANVLSAFAFLLLCYGFFVINRESRFPGGWALVPVLGALLTIFAGPKAWGNRAILSNSLAVWFGIISFPLYLWHWPLLSFARIVEGEVPSSGIRVAAVLLAILLAWLTYKIAERPLRFGQHGKAKVAGLVFSMIVVGCAGYSTYNQDGLFPFISAHAKADDVRAINAEREAVDNCNGIFPDWLKVTDNPCKMQRTRGNTVAIVGDSHAGQLYVGMSELMGSGGIAAFAASCAAPYINFSSGTNDPNDPDPRKRLGAYKLINSAYEFIIKDRDIGTVILAFSPACLFNFRDMADISNSNEESMLQNAIRRTFDALIKADKNVLVLFDNPFLPYEPSMCAPRPFRITNKADKCAFPRTQFDSLPSFVKYKSSVTSVLKDYPGIATYDLSRSLCDGESCYLEKNNALLYRDRNHLNFAGSRYVAPHIMNAINAHFQLESVYHKRGY
ncbi:acyltransferase family protein [Rhodopseudomonas palustris]|uniref:acyltransferase family protein n=1 Tax=Rhodopseudomonas palustris TaxID=1076 RepID=UPI0021F32881|nr:acyltransferase family protein [Rhodopseudomonas palustris]UYO53621.1 acyltransferase [Rhodopseudomonas palustris]